ncbi:MAG: bluetail domain-containing putative surface protein [Rhizomicrobium sp.]
MPSGDTVAAIDPELFGGALSAASFDTDLAAAVDATKLAAHHAVLFTPNAGGDAGSTFLVVDANGVAGYQAGQDFVFEVDHATIAGLAITDFI